MPLLLQVVAEESEEEKVDDKVSRSFMKLRLRVFRACGVWCLTYVYPWYLAGVLQGFLGITTNTYPPKTGFPIGGGTSNYPLSVVWVVTGGRKVEM